MYRKGSCNAVQNLSLECLYCSLHKSGLQVQFKDFCQNIVDAIPHYSDVMMRTMASQITSLAIVYWTVYSEADQRKQQSSTSLAFVRGNSPVAGEFPAQRASNAENVSIRCRHHVLQIPRGCDLISWILVFSTFKTVFTLDKSFVILTTLTFWSLL